MQRETSHLLLACCLTRLVIRLSLTATRRPIQIALLSTARPIPINRIPINWAGLRGRRAGGRWHRRDALRQRAGGHGQQDGGLRVPYLRRRAGECGRRHQSPKDLLS